MSNVNVLIVDDFDDNVFLLEEIISILGFDTKTASNGEMAVEMVKNNNFQLVLMDIEMPVMNGFEAAEEIRELPEPKSETLIIAISAHSHDFFEEKIHKTAINDYISKPYTLNKIITVLQKHNLHVDL